MSATNPIGFDGIASFLAENSTQAKEDLGLYFANYAGRWFEHFSGLSNPDRLDANDIVACGTLSVEFDGQTIQELMGREADINALLAECPSRDTALWDLQPESAEYSALTDLYTLLRGIEGMGPVRTSKLLASKRPHAVPIRDSVVEALLGATTQWWGPWRTVVADEQLRQLVAEVSPPEVPADTSVLRRLDVILWMHGKRHA